jgi:hypothetical protein
MSVIDSLRFFKFRIESLELFPMEIFHDFSVLRIGSLEQIARNAPFAENFSCPLAHHLYYRRDLDVHIPNNISGTC